MKTLFIVVSILALSYLALQTSVVKSYLSGFTYQLDPQLENDPIKNNVYNELVTKINELEKQSAQERANYSLRISELEKDIATLEQSLHNNMQRNIDEQMSLTKHPKQNNARQQLNVSNHIQSKTILPPQPIESTALVSNVETKLGSVDSSEGLISQQQKRVQQQAVLRALSQKMELAALSSLVN